MVSLMGTWMQSTAQGYLMFQLTQSSAYLGYVGFAAGLPSWLFTVYAGAIADRIPRRMMLIVTQASMMILAFILAALTFTNFIRPWHIIFLAFLLGIANAFDAPTRQSFVLEMVERHDLTNAIALNSAMFTSAIVVGPAVGGLVYGWLGPGWCFTINGLSFIAVIAALALMRLSPHVSPRRSKSTWKDIQTGFIFVVQNSLIRRLIANLGVMSVITFGTVTLIPAWVVKILGGDAATNGLVLSARGVGSLTGALLIAALGQQNLRGRLWTMGSFLMPILMLGFAAARWLPLSLAAMVGVGFSFVLLNNIANALVQIHVPDELRGRVMGVFVLVFFGATPIGSLLAGSLADWIGEPLTVIICAISFLVYSGFVWWRMPDIRRLP
jgi:MFS family permease